jgi:hypothetical protein
MDIDAEGRVTRMQGAPGFQDLHFYREQSSPVGTHTSRSDLERADENRSNPS